MFFFLFLINKGHKHLIRFVTGARVPDLVLGGGLPGWSWRCHQWDHPVCKCYPGREWWSKRCCVLCCGSQTAHRHTDDHEAQPPSVPTSKHSFSHVCTISNNGKKLRQKLVLKHANLWIQIPISRSVRVHVWTNIFILWNVKFLIWSIWFFHSEAVLLF